MFTFEYKGGDEPREVSLDVLILEDLGDGLRKMELFAEIEDIAMNNTIGQMTKALSIYKKLVPIYKEYYSTDKSFNDFDWFHSSVPFFEIAVTTEQNWSVGFTLVSQSSKSKNQEKPAKSKMSKK